MQEWVSLKESVAAWVGIDHDALYILASVLLCIAAALITRRPLSSLLPWLAVLAVALANEAASGLADGVFEPRESLVSLHDLALVMAVPTALLLLGRFAPQIMCPRPDLRILVPAAPDRRRGSILDAEFEEIT